MTAPVDGEPREGADRMPGASAIQRVAGFLALIAADGEASEPVERAFAACLAAIKPEALPPAAMPVWREIARLLKSPAGKPIPVKAIAAIRSWPAVRVAELVTHIRSLQMILEATENDRLEDEIRDKIRRHYL